MMPRRITTRTGLSSTYRYDPRAKMLFFGFFSHKIGGALSGTSWTRALGIRVATTCHPKGHTASSASRQTYTIATKEILYHGRGNTMTPAKKKFSICFFVPSPGIHADIESAFMRYLQHNRRVFARKSER